MVYILSAQLYDDAIGYAAFANYRSYLDGPGRDLPVGARALATSDWYFDSNDHRAPHDAWLEVVEIMEGAGSDGRLVSIRLRLLGAYHDGHIELRYRDVGQYRIELKPQPRDAKRGHRDWRHDEFRVSRPGRVEHESDWWGSGNTGTWLIEAADVEYRWAPLPKGEVP
jgi:ribosomal protein S28E/S33